MKEKLVVLADLGHLKIYKMTQDEFSSSPQFELLEDFATSNVHGRMSDILTDGAGRFQGGQPYIHQIRASGERHNIELEFERRGVQQVANAINRAFRNLRGNEPVLFAANGEINKAIVERLDPAVRSRIDKNVPEDLTKINGSKTAQPFRDAFATLKSFKCSVFSQEIRAENLKLKTSRSFKDVREQLRFFGHGQQWFGPP